MGPDDEGFPADCEGPARSVEVSAFEIDQHAVTTAEFLAFVQETDDTTNAERYGWSSVFEPSLSPVARHHAIDDVETAPWWVAVEGANWLHSDGRIVEADTPLYQPHVITRDPGAAFTDWPHE